MQLSGPFGEKRINPDVLLCVSPPQMSKPKRVGCQTNTKISDFPAMQE